MERCAARSRIAAADAADVTAAAAPWRQGVAEQARTAAVDAHHVTAEVLADALRAEPPFARAIRLRAE